MSDWDEERTDPPGTRLGLAEDPFAQGDRRRGDPGRSGLRLIVVAGLAALAVGVLRWQPWSRAAASDPFLWAATVLVGFLLLAGMARCLASIFSAEGSEGRARVGAVLGLALVGAIGVYALSGGYETIVFKDTPATATTVTESGEPAPGTDAYVVDEYEYRGLELKRHVYDDYRFSVDVPGTPYALKGVDLADWDFGVRVVVDVPGVRDDAVFEVVAAVHPDMVNDQAAVDRYLAEIETLYVGEDELRSARSGRLNGRLCAIARSRYDGSQSPEPVVTTAFWVPGNGYEYLVRCVAYEDDWARARRPMMDIAGRFRCW